MSQPFSFSAAQDRAESDFALSDGANLGDLSYSSSFDSPDFEHGLWIRLFTIRVASHPAWPSPVCTVE